MRAMPLETQAAALVKAVRVQKHYPKKPKVSDAAPPIPSPSAAGTPTCAKSHGISTPATPAPAAETVDLTGEDVDEGDDDEEEDWEDVSL